MDLGEVHAEYSVQRLAHLKRRGVRLAGGVPCGRKLVHWRGSAALQPHQDRFNLLVAGGHLGLIDVIQLNCLGQGEDVLLPVIAHQRLADRLDGRMAPHVAVGREGGRIALAGHDGPDDAHTGRSRDVGHDVVELQVHLGQRLLHVLDVSCSVVEQSLTLPQIGPQPRDLGLRPEAAPQQAVFM